MADNKNWDMDMDIAGPTQSSYATYTYEQNVRTYPVDTTPISGTVVINPSPSTYISTSIGGSTISSISGKIDIDPWDLQNHYSRKLKEDYLKYLANLEAKRPFASMPLDHKIDSDIFTKNLKLNPAPAPAPIEPAKPALPAQLELF